VLVDALAAAPDEALRVLVASAPGVFRAAWALLLDGSRVIEASRGAPELDALPSTLHPLPRARRIEPHESWVPQQWQLLATELAAAPVGPGNVLVLLGRPGGPLFRASEVLRLGHLAGIAATVSAVSSTVSSRPEAREGLDPEQSEPNAPDSGYADTRHHRTSCPCWTPVRRSMER
jgi:hypothetical protein